MRLFMTADAVGGVWTYALDLARGLSDCGVKTTLAVLGPRPDAARAARARAVPGLQLLETELPLDWAEPDPARVAAAPVELARLAARADADVVQVNSAALAQAEFTAPVVVAAHSCVATWHAAVRGGALPPDLAWRKAMAARGYEAADVVTAPSRAFADFTAETYGLRRLPLVVRNGRPAARLHNLSRTPACEVFAAGRIWDEGKDLATLDRAAARIGAPVVAAGPLSAPDGGAAAFERLITPGPLSGSEVARRLAARPVFVSSSIYEPFGLSVLEAAQAGCALVLSDIPSFRELWQGAADFVPARDDAALAFAVNALLADPERRARQGGAARARGRRYTAQAMAAGMLGVYRSILLPAGEGWGDERRRKAPDAIANDLAIAAKNAAAELRLGYARGEREDEGRFAGEGAQPSPPAPTSARFAGSGAREALSRGERGPAAIGEAAA